MSLEYFDEKLNYSLGNEDSRIEKDLFSGAKRILCIAGSGARVAPLMANEPELIDVLDVSQFQLEFTKIRITAIQTLDFEDYLGLWGYKKIPADKRKKLFSQLKLDSITQSFWQKLEGSWSENGWLTLGDWENSLRILGTSFCKYFRKDMTPLFQAKTLKEQADVFRKYWPSIRLQVYFHMVANKTMLNKLLYRGKLLTPGFVLEKNCSNFLYKTIERLFQTTVARENFLLQWIFLGEVLYPENSLPETTFETFMQIKKSSTVVNYIKGDALHYLSNASNYDAYSFSDIVSYMTPDAPEQILKEISKSGSNQIAVFRSFLKHPQKSSLPDWDNQIQTENDALKNDTTGVYRFHIYSRNTKPL